MVKARITCIFCQAVVSADKNLNKYKKHLEISHDIFYQQDLALTLAFLDDEEADACERFKSAKELHDDLFVSASENDLYFILLNILKEKNYT